MVTIIDAHQHAFWHGRDDKGLVADLDEHGISQAWLLTWEIPVREDRAKYHSVLNSCRVRADGTHQGIVLSDMVAARNRFPDRFILGYCPDPLATDPAGLFESAYRMHGVRICGEWKFRVQVDDPRCLNLFRKAGQLKCPVVIHLDVPFSRNEAGQMEYQPEWYGGTVENLERALQTCPDTTFLGHAPGFWREINGRADFDTELYPTTPIAPGGKIYRLFDTYSNLYGDMSATSALNALTRDPAHAKTFLVRFADKLLFARDTFGQQLHAFLQGLSLPASVQEKIYFRNAQRLIHI